jgi:dTDP-4-amino-4,6-dideoxygalactose transaminase
MTALAIHGGTPVRTEPLPPSNTIGEEEKAAAIRVIESGALSVFLGAWGDEFNGGREVMGCEAAFAERVEAKHAIAVNSATTGLEVALGAAGVGPGDEVIVPPFTMSASASAILARNAIPVFADIEDETFGLDPESVAGRLSSQTRAILVVHLFGHPARMSQLLELADQHGLAVIEDAAQSLGATFEGRQTGTLGHAGVLSLNRHKIIQCGEGGIVLTNDDAVARMARLLRNHGEAVVEDEGGDPVGVLGSNYRMTEIEAAIAGEQLKRLDHELAIRRDLAQRLNRRLAERPELATPGIRPGATHSYYVYALRLVDPAIDRAAFARALRAEGIPAGEGYVRPLYLQPIYAHRSARGAQGCPWTCGHWKGQVSYERGICPTAERLHDRELLILDVVRSPLTPGDIDDVADAIEKVLNGREALETG